MTAPLFPPSPPNRACLGCIMKPRSICCANPFERDTDVQFCNCRQAPGKPASQPIVLGSLSKERHAIFVVPRLSLIEQTVAAFEREGIWNIGVLQGRHFRTNPNAPVQIASAQTLVRRDIPSVDIVIVDECHLQFEKISKWIASCECSAVPFVGLPATPWSRGLGKSYDDLLRPVSIQELIAEGYLSPFRIFAPPAPDLTGVRTVAGDDGADPQHARSFGPEGLLRRSTFG
jgi:superfamily II DNA or RNA helicase